MSASGHTLSRVALVRSRGRRGQKSQDGWPDEKRRRVLRRLSLSLLLFLKCRWQFLLRQEALFLSSLPSVVQDLARFFFVPVKILFSGSVFAVLRAWLRRLLGLGSVVPFDFCSWCSRNWCCVCDACWSW